LYIDVITLLVFLYNYSSDVQFEVRCKADAEDVQKKRKERKGTKIKAQAGIVFQNLLSNVRTSLKIS
jgi:hypothetical protein